MSFAMLFPQRQIPLPYHRALNTQKQQRSAPSFQHQQQQQHQPNSPLPTPHSSDRLNGKIYVSPLESKLGLHKLLLPVIGEVKRMRWASLPLTAPAIPSIHHSQAPEGTAHHDNDGAGLISLPGARTRRDTEGQNVLNVDEGPAAADPRGTPWSEPSTVDPPAGESLAASQHPTQLSAGSVGAADAEPIVEMGTAASRARSEEEGGKLHGGEAENVTEQGEKLAVESPAAAVDSKEVKTEELGSDVQSPRDSAPRRTPGVDAGEPDDCEILSSPPAAFKKAQTIAPQAGSGQIEVSTQGQRPLTPAGSLGDMAAQPASQGAPTSHQSPTTAPPKVNSPTPTQPTIPPTTVPLPPAATHAPTNNSPSNPPPAQKLTHRELKRIMDALRQRTGDQDLPPALKQRYDFAVRLMREAMITRSSADLPKGLVPIYQSHIDRIVAAEAVVYANTQAPSERQAQTGRKRVAGESVGGEAEKRRRPSGGSSYPGVGSSAMPSGPPGRVAPGPSHQPPHAATKTAISMTPEPTDHRPGPQIHPFGHGPNNVQQPEAAPRDGGNALSGYTHIAWRRETENPNHPPYSHEYPGMPANRRLWPQKSLGPHVRTLQDEIYEHQVPFIHPRLPDDVYTSEEMEVGNSKGSLNIRAESGSPFAAGQFPKSSNVPLKRGPPIEAESTGVSRPRKKRATGAAVDPIDLSTETSADNINGAPATPTATVTKGRKQPAVRRKPAMKKAAAGAAILPTQSLAMTRGAEMESGTPGMGSSATSILDEPKRDSATEHAALSTSFTELLENEDDGAWMGMAGFAR